jgi:hypothetical protein
MSVHVDELVMLQKTRSAYMEGRAFALQLKRRKAYHGRRLCRRWGCRQPKQMLGWDRQARVCEREQSAGYASVFVPYILTRHWLRHPKRTVIGRK